VLWIVVQILDWIAIRMSYELANKNMITSMLPCLSQLVTDICVCYTVTPGSTCYMPQCFDCVNWVT